MADTENIAVEAPAEPEVSVPASQPAAPASPADPASTDLLKQILEQNQKVIRISYIICFAPQSRLYQLLKPQVKHIVQIYIGQHG